jgi:O-antigen/teichoic acid export membrane protein
MVHVLPLFIKNNSLGIVIRQSFKSIIVQYLGVVLGYINIVWLFPKCLPLEQIGLIRFILEMGLFLAYFAQIGVPNAVNKFYPYFRNKEKNDQGFQFFIFVTPIIGILFFSIAFIFMRPLFVSSFQENSPLVLHYYWYFIPFTIIYVYQNITEQYCSSQMRIVVPKIIRDVYLRFGISLLLIANYLHYLTFDQLMIAITILYFTGLLINISYIHYLWGINLKPDFSVLKEAKVKKEILYFLGFIIIAGIGSTLVNKIDSYMISSLIDLSSFTIYSTALFFATVIEMPYRSVSQISIPIVAEAFKQQDIKKIETIYKKSAINQTLVGLAIFLLIWINIDSIFAMMPNEELFKGGKYVFFFIGLSKIFDLLTGINSPILAISKYYYFGLYFMFVLAAIAITSNYLLIPHLGIVGVGIATALSILIYNSLLTFFVNYKMNIHPFTLQTLWLLMIGAGVFVLNMFIPSLANIYLDIILHSAIIMGLYLFLIYRFCISEEMNNTMRVVLDRIKTRRIR